jgi:hypothetical protein
MGAAGSITSSNITPTSITSTSITSSNITPSNITSSSIYLSYDINVTNENSNIYIQTLCKKLKERGINIIYSELTMETINKSLTAVENSQIIENIMKDSSYIIMCVSEKGFFKSYYQTFEINYALNSGKEIIYIMLDEEYTPATRSELYCINKNKWFPLCNKNHLDYLLYEINTIKI